MRNLKFEFPQWNAPANVKSMVTTRGGGFSRGAYSEFNLATHVGDDFEAVMRNRNLLGQYLPSSPIWLNQVHGVSVFNAVDVTISEVPPNADAVVTNKPNQVLSIMTADCLPILFAHKSGVVIGAAHAGWRGLCNGVIENTVSEMIKVLNQMEIRNNPADILVWLGPSIGQNDFEVGREVFDSFMNVAKDPNRVNSCFRPQATSGKYLADLHKLAKIRLSELEIANISETSDCCFKQKENYFSFRRDKVTGRFASLIWIDSKSS